MALFWQRTDTSRLRGYLQKPSSYAVSAHRTAPDIQFNLPGTVYIYIISKSIDIEVHKKGVVFMIVYLIGGIYPIL